MARNTVTGRKRAQGSGLRAQGASRAEARSAESGFTLIELMIVVTLVIVLAGIGLATYTTSITRAKEATLREDLFRLRDAIDQYSADKGHDPADLATLVTDGYLRRIPEDPLTKSADSWQTVMGETDTADPAAIPGVHDVKSGAEGSGLDGTPYSEW
jgi:general secretion pathway protein G